MRALIKEFPFEKTSPLTHWDRGSWPSCWIRHPDPLTPPFVTAYRREFGIEEDAIVRIHVSADERYELFLDGVRLGRGPERGAPHWWYFETYDLDLKKGRHMLVARVWSMGKKLAPTAQMSVTPGFLLAPDRSEFLEVLGTGSAPWEVMVLRGFDYTPAVHEFGVGHNVDITGAEFAWGYERGEGTGWLPAKPGERAKSGPQANLCQDVHLLYPATLPPMLDTPRQIGTARYSKVVAGINTRSVQIFDAENDAVACGRWDQLLKHGSCVAIPPNTIERVIIDLENYYCAYPQITVSGGKEGFVRLLWAEALFYAPDSVSDYRKDGDSKGNRDEIDGKYFIGYGDIFRPDGGEHREFRPLWWQAGRYLELVIQTGAQELTIEGILFFETRYPLEMESHFSFDKPELVECLPMMVRAMQSCAHETYFDCPYYEQLMYVGDTRLEVLTHFAMQRDSRLPGKAVHLFDISRIPRGLTQARYPSNSMSLIAPFSLWWVAMVHDLALWRGNLEQVKRTMPFCRSVLDHFLQHLNADGVLDPPEGWNFMDWVPNWFWGCPPDGERSINSVQGWQLAHVLGLAAQVEEWLGEDTLAERDRRLAATLSANLTKVFWDEGRGLFADNPSKTRWSEHAQCLAILSDQLGHAAESRLLENMLRSGDLEKTTIYFSHYYFEACRKLGRMDAFMDRMAIWFELKGRGFKTTFEKPGDSRSDCHAWGAHPLYHYYASILGVRPSAMGFATVEVRPQLGGMTSAKGKLIHPMGFIEVDYQVEAGFLTSSITLPEGISGVFLHKNREEPLGPGRNELRTPCSDLLPTAP